MNNIFNLSLEKLKRRNILNPYLDLKIILNYSSNIKEKDINLSKFKKILNRRLKNEPISKIVNNKSFWKYDFYVDKNVLDPRPETELIIEETLKLIKNKNKKINILDIGTGSGCLAVCLAKEYKKSIITAVDISDKAMKIALRNFKIHECEKQIINKVCNIESINLTQSFDLIVSNPPYLSEKEYSNTSKEIRYYEPSIAFLGGENGLLFYKKFASLVPKIMNYKSYLILEIGEKQALNCIKIFKESGLNFVKKVKDLQKKDRILIFSKL